MNAPGAPLLCVSGLEIAFRGADGSTLAVRGVEFQIAAGERVALVGESGSGKSVTALALMGLLPRAASVIGGRIVLGEHDVTTASEELMARLRGREIAMVYQSPLSALNPVHTIGRQLIEAIRCHDDVSVGAARRTAVDLLAELGVPDPGGRLRAYPHEFSGGMRQRVVIAMALAANPRLLIADEATTALDVTTQARIVELLDRVVQARGMALLMITHDIALASGLVDRVLVMYAGRVVESCAIDAFTALPDHPYSRALRAATCDLDTDVDRPIPTIPGAPPVAGRFPSGCAFHPRCPYAVEVCSTQEPPTRRAQEPGDAIVACHRAFELDDTEVGVG